jgi:ABC-2 type transport system ATP-binding protein
MDGAAVRLDHVRRTFGGAVALADLNLEARAGTVTVMLGPNGAGKTTALRMITGALPPDSGSVRVLGMDPAEAGDQIRSRCGVVSAKPALYDRLSGRDNLLYAAQLWGLGKAAPIEEAAARFGIADALGQRVGGYSTGMKTRLALARAILHEPDLLLLDEPTSGLDPEAAQAVLRLIDDLAEQGKTVVMCTHLLLEAEGLADWVVMLDAGADVVSGAPGDLVRRYWPVPEVIVDAEDREQLQYLLSTIEGVQSQRANGGPIRVQLDSLSRVPDLVGILAREGVRLTKVAPHEPTLEELYLAVRGAS